MGFFKAEGLISGWVGKYRKINSFRIIGQSTKQENGRFNNLPLDIYGIYNNFNRIYNWIWFISVASKEEIKSEIEIMKKMS